MAAKKQKDAEWWYTMDRGGVTEILKSKEVKAELNSLAADLCSQANRLEAQHGYGVGDYEVGEAKNLTHTSEAAVYTHGYGAFLDQEHYHTLNAINH